MTQVVEHFPSNVQGPGFKLQYTLPVLKNIKRGMNRRRKEGRKEEL
jgi:hypothetical protein